MVPPGSASKVSGAGFPSCSAARASGAPDAAASATPLSCSSALRPCHSRQIETWQWRASIVDPMAGHTFRGIPGWATDPRAKVETCRNVAGVFWLWGAGRRFWVPSAIPSSAIPSVVAPAPACVRRFWNCVERVPAALPLAARPPRHLSAVPTVPLETRARRHPSLGPS